MSSKKCPVVVTARPGPHIVFEPEPVPVFCLRHIIKSRNHGLVTKPVNQTRFMERFYDAVGMSASST